LCCSLSGTPRRALGSRMCAGAVKKAIRLKPECIYQVLGTSGRPSVNDLTLQDLTEVLTHQG
jgi:hypothetical protein